MVGKTNKGRQDSWEDVYKSWETHLSLRVGVLKFHVLVKFSFGQQIEQHQVTDHRCLQDVQGHFQCVYTKIQGGNKLLLLVSAGHTTPKMPTPEPIAVSVGIMLNFLACEGR